MNAVTGPSVEWLHRHTEARLCLGDALLDSCRENAGQSCIKTFSYRSRLPEPVNPTSMECKVCSKCKPPYHFGDFSKIPNIDTDAASPTPVTAYDFWNRWCNVCDIIVCHTCVNNRRDAHRHNMLWTRVVKVNVNASWTFGQNKQCDRCGQQYLSNLFQGFECAGCRQYHCCISCVQKKIFPQHFCSGQPAAFDLLLRKA